MGKVGGTYYQEEPTFPNKDGILLLKPQDAAGTEAEGLYLWMRGHHSLIRKGTEPLRTLNRPSRGRNTGSLRTTSCTEWADASLSVAVLKHAGFGLRWAGLRPKIDRSLRFSTIVGDCCSAVITGRARRSPVCKRKVGGDPALWPRLSRPDMPIWNCSSKAWLLRM